MVSMDFITLTNKPLNYYFEIFLICVFKRMFSLSLVGKLTHVIRLKSNGKNFISLKWFLWVLSYFPDFIKFVVSFISFYIHFFC